MSWFLITCVHSYNLLKKQYNFPSHSHLNLNFTTGFTSAKFVLLRSRFLLRMGLVVSLRELTGTGTMMRDGCGFAMSRISSSVRWYVLFEYFAVPAVSRIRKITIVLLQSVTRIINRLMALSGGSWSKILVRLSIYAKRLRDLLFEVRPELCDNLFSKSCAITFLGAGHKFRTRCEAFFRSFSQS